ncbi:hypothetical protein [Streptomyces aureoverticillatus]|uniref:hypothetical protein n=1 Tax=Streptomyces aureoverticillatus TaxID=66871 RepID=UPI0013DD766D|nr:hypothetical protein [Streptomyces aureoverticillatus]QIB49508.1 hypothetical protein G3H79_40775 [Streptomyces aureoverticillatus]
MISIIRRSTRFAYEQAMETAQRVPGLEGELTRERGRADDFEQKSCNLEQLLEERDGTIEKLRTVLDSLRRASDEIAALMATAPSPAAAGYHAARVLLAHADQFRLADTAEGRAGLETMRELTEPQAVTLLYRYGRRQSVHATVADAKAAAQRQGASPDGWEPVRYTDWQDLDASWLDAPWSTTTLAVDASEPWTTPREPLASVYVLMRGGLPYAAFSSPDDAIREQDRQGIPRTADSLIRMELATEDATAAA